MLKYAAQRILLMLVTLFIITLICFVLIRMLPVAVLSDNATDVAKTNAIMARREALGYGKPYLVQFGIFLKRVFTKWDWGMSDVLYYGRDVAEVFGRLLPATMTVNLMSTLKNEIGRKVYIKPTSKGKGTLTIEFYSDKELTEFAKKLAGE